MSEEENTTVEAEPAVETEPAPTAPVAHGHGIGETKEILAALDVVAEFLAKTLADGQINGSDFVHLVGLMQDLDKFSAAVKGVKNVDDELKDLDEAELIELGMSVYKLVKKVVAAVKRK